MAAHQVAREERTWTMDGGVTELAEYCGGRTWGVVQCWSLILLVVFGWKRTETRGPGCWGTGASTESDATAVDCDCGNIECGRPTVVAELVDGDERA
jgi:hypothetical protein